MIKLIIFDLDGVLVDTESLHKRALIEAAYTITGIEFETLNVLFSIDGKTTSTKLKNLQALYNLNDNILNRIDALKQSIVVSSMPSIINTNVDHRGMLSELEREYTVSLASNSRRENVDLILDLLNITDLFSTVVAGNEVLATKPDPYIFNKIMELHNISPAHTLILEDSPAGKHAAKLSGAHLLEVNSINDVTLENIKYELQQISANNSCANGRDGISIY